MDKPSELCQLHRQLPLYARTQKEMGAADVTRWAPRTAGVPKSLFYYVGHYVHERFGLRSWTPPGTSSASCDASCPYTLEFKNEMGAADVTRWAPRTAGVPKSLFYDLGHYVHERFCLQT